MRERLTRSKTSVRIDFEYSFWKLKYSQSIKRFHILTSQMAKDRETWINLKKVISSAWIFNGLTTSTLAAYIFPHSILFHFSPNCKDKPQPEVSLIQYEIAAFKCEFPWSNFLKHSKDLFECNTGQIKMQWKFWSYCCCRFFFGFHCVGCCFATNFILETLI